jgi:hypothetical protein
LPRGPRITAERNESGRIDRQFFGRGARRGDLSSRMTRAVLRPAQQRKSVMRADHRLDENLGFAGGLHAG